MKKLLLTTAISLLCIVSTWAAGDTFTYQDGEGYNLKYQVNSNDTTVTLISLADDETAGSADLIIPETVSNDETTYTVTSIGNLAFYRNSDFTGSLIIGNNVTSIGISAFRECTGFTGSLVIPDGVTSIQKYAFYACCSLTGSLTIPNGVTTIEEYAFNYCIGFTDTLTIGENVTNIGSVAFKDCEGFTTVESKATKPPYAEESSFAGLNSLSLIVPNAEAAKKYQDWNQFANYVYGTYYTITYKANGGTGYTSAQLVMPDSICHFNKNKFEYDGYYCVGWATTSTASQAEYAVCEEFAPTADITLYAVWSEVFVVITGDGYNLKYAVNLGTQTATCVGMVPLSDEMSANLVIPETVIYNEETYSVTNIADYAFHRCIKLRGSVIIGDNVTSIGEVAFASSLFGGTLTIGNSVTSIGDDAFNYASLSGSLTIPNSVTTIGKRAFYCIGFTGSLVIPNSVTTIGGDAFGLCDGFYGTLTIGNSVTHIGYGAFYDCTGFTGSLVIPNSVTSIGGMAFYNCDSLTGSLTIGNGVRSIEAGAFLYCDGFKDSLIIGSGVTSIGDYAFGYSSGFTTIESKATNVPKTYASAFKDLNYDMPLTVPFGTKEAYKKAPGWENFTNIIEAAATGVTDTPAPAPFIQIENTLYFSVPTAAAIYNVSGTMLYSGELMEYTLPNRIGVYIICTDFGNYKVLSK